MIFNADRPPSQSNQITLYNDWKDLNFSIFLGEPQKDGWRNYGCGFFRYQTLTNSFVPIYSTHTGEVVTEISGQDIQELYEFIKKVSEGAQSDEFVVGPRDFRILVTRDEDIFRCQIAIDLHSVRPEKLDVGLGDSEITLTFNTTQQNLKEFSEDLASKM